jgi:hypothetical protein
VHPFLLSGRTFGRLVSRGGRSVTALARNFPSNITVQLHRVDVHFGTRRSAMVGAGSKRRRVTYNLLTNPSTCARRGWPFLLTVSYTTGTEKYAAYGRCHS